MNGFIPDFYMAQIRADLARTSFLHSLLPPPIPLTRRQRLTRWWDSHRPRTHFGPCNHDGCDW